MNTWQFDGAVTGQNIISQAIGSDADIGLVFSSKGTSGLSFRTSALSLIQFEVLSTASATRRITVTGSNGGNPILATTAGLLSITPGVLIGTATSSGFNTGGLTINQAAADDEILSLKSSDVAHDMTSISDTDTFGLLSKESGTAGGLKIQGLSEVTIGLELRGIHTTDNTAKSTAALGAVFISGSLKSGGGQTTLGADANILVVATSGTARFILDGDGDSHQDVGTAWTNFDHLDDIATLDALAYNVARGDDPIKRKFGEFLLEKRPELEKNKLVTFNSDGHHFVNMSKLTMLHTGAIRQLSEQLDEFKQIIIEQKNLINQLQLRLQ